MKTINVSEATGAALDWLVAKCEGMDPPYGWNPTMGVPVPVPFSTDHGLAGPILEREHITRKSTLPSRTWQAFKTRFYGDPAAQQVENIHWSVGPTSLVAGLRCYLTYKLGTVAEVPEDLLV